MPNQKVLIVDDSKAIRMQVREMLPKGSFEVLEAQDGIEGLDLIQRETPTLVLLDFFMPQMNGWEVLDRLRLNPRLSHIPIVMMSGRKEEVEQQIPDLFDYFEFISKPFEQAHLIQAIKSAMVKARNRQQGISPKKAQGAGAMSTRSMATPSASAPPQTPASEDLSIAALKSELEALRQENQRLRADVGNLQKQVSQILTFIRQRLK